MNNKIRDTRMGDWTSTIIGSILGAIFTPLLAIPTKSILNYIKFKNNGIFLKTKYLKKKIDKKKRIRRKLSSLFFDKWDSRYVSIDKRERELYSRLKRGNDVRVVAPIARGKTRTSIEVIRKLVIDKAKVDNTTKCFQKAKLILLNKDSDFNQKTYRNFFMKKWNFIILLFDDIDKITVKLLNEGTSLNAVIQKYRKISSHIQLICTCQSEEWFLAGKTIARRDAFLDERDDIEKLFPYRVEIPELTKTEWRILADLLEIKTEIDNYSGEPGDLVFDTVSKKKKYNNLNSKQKNFLKAIKIFVISNIFNPPVLLLSTVAREHFSVGNQWREIYTDLKLADFYRVKDEKIIIPEIYLQRVIWDYPEEKQVLIEDLNFMVSFFEKEESSNYLNSLAATYLKLNFDEKALEVLSKAIGLEDGIPYYYSNRGYVYEKLGDFDKAIEDYNLGIDLDPNNSGIYNNRGNANQKTGNISSAIEDYDKAIELDASNSDPYNNKSVIYIRTGDWETALRLCDNAIALNPNNASTYNNRGIVYSNLKRYDDAFNDFNKALEIDPNFTKAYINRGKVLDDTGKHAESLNDYNKAIKLNENDPIAYNNRGRVLYHLEQYERALEDYNKAIELDSEYVDPYNNRALEYTRRGDSNRALRDYDSAIRVNPNYATAYNNKGTLLLRLGRLKESHDLLTKVIELEPENEEAILNRGLTLWGLDEKEKAFDELNKILVLNDKNALVHYNRAQFHAELENVEYALKDYTTAWSLREQLPQKGGEMPYFVIKLLIHQTEIPFSELRKWFKLAEQFYSFYPDEIKSTIDEAGQLLQKYEEERRSNE